MFRRKKKVSSYPIDPETGLPKLAGGRKWKVSRDSTIRHQINVALLDHDGKVLECQNYSTGYSEIYDAYYPDSLPKYCARILKSYNTRYDRINAVEKTLGTYPPNKFEE